MSGRTMANRIVPLGTCQLHQSALELYNPTLYLLQRAGTDRRLRRRLRHRVEVPFEVSRLASIAGMAGAQQTGRSPTGISALQGPDVLPNADPVDGISGSKFEKELYEYICNGPLQESCRISPAAVKDQFPRWLELGDLLIANLGFPPKNELSPAQRMRIYQYYLPIYFWCESQLEQHAKGGKAGSPLVIGIQAPQGCGKTTIVEELEKLFEHTGRKAATVSIDDFYLTYEAQTALAKANPHNKLLQLRGNAGSHDLQLGTATLEALVSAVRPGQRVSVPRYDKSQYGGRGDRAPPSDWPVVNGPVDVILFEGWMLGFAPVSDQEAAAVSPDLVEVNHYLQAYKEAWDRFVDAWLVVKVADPKYVYNWRLQAEHAMRAKGKPGMTDEEVADFVDRYMPAYLGYLKGLYSHGPTSGQSGHVLMIEIGEDRSLSPQQPKSPL
eukprot:jgi/Botrbrau1/12678/Bobra.67_1s0042.1